MKALAFMPAPIKELPWRMIVPVVAIGAFSCVVLYSAAGGGMRWAFPQAARFLVFLGIAIAMSRLRPEWIKQAAFPAYVIVLVLLVAVEALGFVGGGARRWINLGPLNLQPSELMKPVIVLACAHFYSLLPAREIRGWSALWPAGVLIGIPAVFILVQPDLGTAMMVVLGGVTVMFLAGVPLRLFGGGVLGAAILGPIAFHFLHDYQRQRVLIFLDPESDPLHTGYHITQSKIALGSGGLFGKGFLLGTQTHLSFLPEKQTDFIFTMIAEEFGLVGGLILLGLYVVLIGYAFAIALRSRSLFGRLLGLGIAANFFLYAFINTAMVMGLIPVVGVPLPLISYGGTAMITMMLGFGLLMNVGVHRDVRISRRGESELG